MAREDITDFGINLDGPDFFRDLNRKIESRVVADKTAAQRIRTTKDKGGWIGVDEIDWEGSR